MRKQLSFVLAVAVGTVLPDVARAKSSVSKDYGKQPLVFVENKGQINDQYGNPRTDIDFRLRSGGIQVFIGDGQLHYQWTAAAEDAPVDFASLLYRGENTPLRYQTYRMDVKLMGASAGTLQKISPASYQERYYTSYCAGGTTAGSYEKLVYRNVYPNVDWVLYTKNNQLEYDFVVHPGGNVANIQLEYSGATALNLQEDGSLQAVTPFGSVTEAAPYSFQEDGTVVASSFALKGNKLGFTTAQYKGRLTIDPLVSWGTYFGGTGLWDAINEMAAMPGGGVVLAGHATSVDNIATVGAHQTTISGTEDGFVARFAGDGTLLWSTYYGGPASDEATSVAVDEQGNIYTAGRTTSDVGIATPGAHQSTLGGAMDHFVVKFDSTGTRIFGTYFGGDGNEGGFTTIAVKGNYFYTSGSTMSATAIATPGAHQTVMSNSPDAYLTKFDLNGVRQWSTYYGGENADGFLTSVAVDNSGNVFLFGNTGSTTGIATSGAHQPALGDPNSHDHFLAKFDENGSRQWGTYYGGSLAEQLHFSSRNVQCDELGNVYITGATHSTDGIASPGAFQTTAGGDVDVYLAKFNGDGVRQWATFLGGSGMEAFPGIKVVNSNLIYLCMASASANMPVTPNALQSAFGGGSAYGDAFLSSFDGDGNPIYASYFGGTGIECTGATAIDDQGYVYLAGITNSMSGIATPNSHMDAYPGTLVWTGFLTRFCFAPNAMAIPILGPDSVCRYGEATYTTPAVDDATDYIWSLPDGWTGNSNTNSIDVVATETGGAISLRVVRCGDTSEMVQIEVVVRPADPATLTYEDGVLTANGNYSSYSWVKNGQVMPSTNFPSVSISEDGEYRVITVNEYGCVDTSEVYVVENVHTKDWSKMANAVRIFPNPTQELVHIQAPVKVNVQITSIDGRVLMVASSATTISLQSLTPGMYVVRITTQDGQLLKSEKFVKMNQ